MHKDYCKGCDEHICGDCVARDAMATDLENLREALKALWRNCAQDVIPPQIVNKVTDALAGRGTR